MRRKVIWAPFQFLTMLVIASCGESDPAGEPSELIMLDTLALLVDDGSHGGVFSEVTPAVRTGPGNGLTASTLSWTRLAEFDDRGRMVRTIGTPGDGPGEFRMPTPPLELPDGRLLVHDVIRRRFIEFDGRFTFVREHLTEGPSPLFMREDGLLVGTGLLGNAEAQGRPAHLLDVEGNRVASFGSETGEVRTDNQTESSTWAAPAPDGLVWLAAATRYRVELWDPHENRLERVLEPSVEWFDSGMGSSGLANEPPRSYVKGIWQDGGGPLWVLLSRASRDWRPTDEGPSGGHHVISPEDRTEKYEVVLHALHPESGVIIAEIYLDGNFRHFPPGMLLVGRSQVSEGTVKVPVILPRLFPSHGDGGLSEGP